MFNTDRFSYNKETKTFATCISDLGTTAVFERIYNDAADEGLTLVSDKTGVEATFYLDHVKSDREGDVIEWILKPTTETIRKHPSMKDVRVVIFND